MARGDSDQAYKRHGPAQTTAGIGHFSKRMCAKCGPVSVVLGGKYLGPARLFVCGTCLAKRQAMEAP